MSPHPALTVRGLAKSFGAHTVLTNVDLDVAAGTVYSCSAPTERARPRSCASSPP